MSELRQDLVSGDWVVIAPERAKRPHDVLPPRRERTPSPVEKCPFEDLVKSGNGPVLLASPYPENWRAVIIPNKFPALLHHEHCATMRQKGPYTFAHGIGHHDLLITRDHNKHLSELSKSEISEAFQLLQERYRILTNDTCMVYASSFYNWGASAGSSLWHSHCQLLSLPIVPPEVEHSLRGSQAYYHSHRECVHCEMLRYENRSKTRLIAQNDRAVLLAPYASRQPFEVRIYPKRHYPYFEQTPIRDLESVLELLQIALKKMESNLNDPDLNFFIHTAPLKKQTYYRHYHWHIEVIPKISILAGFELSTGMEINVVDPDQAASILKAGR